MKRITFSDGQTRSDVSRSQKSSSKMTNMLIKYSFGLIRTEPQAQMCKLAVVVIGVIWFLVTMLSFEGDTIEPPTQDLINAEQPIAPL